MNKPNKSKRERLRRYGFIVSNPFLATASNELKVLDPNNLTDEQKLLFSKTQRDYSEFKKNGLEKYFDFALCEYDLKENKEVIGKVVAERIFFKSNELAQEYFKSITFIEYLCYQVEIGEEGGVQHFQGFMRFKQPMDFEVVHSVLPMFSLYICDGSNTDNRNYCIKEKTKDPNYEFYEQGEFKEERQRTDITEFQVDVVNNMSIDELFVKHPNLTLQHFNKINALQQAIINQKYKNEVRTLHTTYIYGKADVGKTTYPQRVLGLPPMAVAKINDSSADKIFDNYNGQDYILFDEFVGKIAITKLNDYLDGQPLWLPARYGDKVACYHNVFVISNYSLADQYRTERFNGKAPSYDGFLRRIYGVIYMPERNTYIWQKGEPTQLILDKLKEQNAIVEVKGDK